MDFATRSNDAIARSVVGRWFKLDGSGVKGERKGSRFWTEVRAGITTFSAMVYIISVNAIILSQSGGNCVCNGGADDPICLTNTEYALCKDEVRRDLITATAGVSAMSSFLMGLFANLPVTLAPGMGLNAYFAFSVVGFNGTGSIPYSKALAAVFLEGWLFVILTLLGIRQWLARTIPRSLTLATGAGIGLFIAFIGLLPAGGIGVIGGDYANMVGLGGCKDQYQDPEHPYYCLSHVLQRPTIWIGIFLGGFLTVLLMIYRIRGAILCGIILVSIISWPRSTSVTYFPHTPAGDANFDFFKKVVTFRPIQRTLNAIDYEYSDGKIWLALITFLYVDIMDTTGTLYSMARFAGVMNERTADFENSTIAYCIDAFSISIGALFGTSPVTAFIESATGISEGGKTGLTAITSGLCFFISIFFAPIFASIPAWATGGALVISGSLMIRNVVDINWSYLGDAVPAFLTLIIIPFSFNIAYGLIAGICAMVILKGVPWAISKATGGRIQPPNYEAREDWGFPSGGLAPQWAKKLAKGDRRFWVPDEDEIALPHHNKETGSPRSGSLDEKHEGSEKAPPHLVHEAPPETEGPNKPVTSPV
ncbi:probable Purine Transporter AzgA [Serendipita indica DSM 11827]|uniref:Probable Purine Transporter AzgA n=1 Tax=Serendipita indica (strain DSM 11827) TaxID=1109443 RepID=G4T772_SERID|nr:probable Purine Transporter AzgA [Serendipita indica DSM 11827]